MASSKYLAWQQASRSLVIAAALCLTACAGLKLSPVSSHAVDVSLGLPATIALVVDNDSPPPVKEKRRAQQRIDAQTASAAIDRTIRTFLASRHLSVVPAGQRADLTLQCRIKEVKGGSDALRIFVGYGAGKAVLRVEVTLTDSRGQATPALLAFETDSTSGSMPPGGHNIHHGLAQEIDRTTASIQSQLDQYFLAQHWLGKSGTQ